MAIDYGTPVGQVRLLIADIDESAFIFTDDQIGAFLSITGDNVRRAAARALRAMAASEVLLARKIRTQDLQTDGPAVAAELRQQADDLEEEEDAAESSFFGYVPLGNGYGREGEEVKFW